MGSGFAINVTMLAYLAKRIPKMIRGMTIAVIAVMSCVGSIIYLQLYAHLNRGGENPYATFTAVIYINLVALAGIVICILFGLYGSAEGGHGQEEERVEPGYMDD